MMTVERLQGPCQFEVKLHLERLVCLGNIHHSLSRLRSWELVDGDQSAKQQLNAPNRRLRSFDSNGRYKSLDYHCSNWSRKLRDRVKWFPLYLECCYSNGLNYCLCKVVYMQSSSKTIATQTRDTYVSIAILWRSYADCKGCIQIALYDCPPQF